MDDDVVDMGEGFSLWVGTVDERLLVAADEVEQGSARLIAAYRCSACSGKKRKPLARTFDTSVGRLWRVYVGDALVDEMGKAGHPVACPVHGGAAVVATQATPKPPLRGT